MAESVNLEASITILRLTLSKDATAVTPASVAFEVQLVGDPASRKLASVYGEANSVTMPSPTPMMSGSARSTVLRFALTAQELGLPLDPAVAATAIESTRVLIERAAETLERVVSKWFTEWRADSVIRFARSHDWIPSPKLTLPPSAVRQLADVLSRVLREDEPLWLEFAEPLGYLPLVPWEDVLRKATRSPVLRLSPHALQPVTPRSVFTIVLAVSLTSAKRLPSIDAAFLESIRAALPSGSLIHVFADALAQPLFATALSSIERPDGIQLHTLPRPAPPVGTPSPSPTPTADAAGDRADARLVGEHPWVAWMTRELGGHAVDIVHWMSPGAYPDEGILVAMDPGEMPVDDGEKSFGNARTFRFVPVPALANFLTTVGAWGAIFTAAPESPTRSRLGLRITTDRMARHRPGVAAMHDLADDPASLALGDTYRFLLGGYDVPTPHRAGILAYTHPALTGAASGTPLAAPSPSVGSGRLLEAYRGVAVAAQTILDREGPAPGWVAATQRIAEQSASRFMSASAAAGDPAVEQGVADALSVLRSLLEAEAKPQGQATTRGEAEGPANA